MRTAEPAGQQGSITAAAARSPSPTINDLSDDVLLAVMERICWQERHSILALVCRRWAQLVVSPPLVRSISLDTRYMGGSEAQQYIHSLCAWLLRHAATSGVRRLHICLSPPSDSSDEDEEDEVLFSETSTCEAVYTTEKEMLRAVLSAAAACCRPAGTSGGHPSNGSSGGGLEELILELEDFGPWQLTPRVVSSLAGLRVLEIRHVSGEGHLRVGSPLLPLVGLQELRLEAGDGVKLGRDATLPPSLTKLHLECLGRVPKQILTLPALKYLALDSADHHAGPPHSQAYNCLHQLANSLELLDLRFCSSLPSPATLAALPRLQALHIESAQVGGEFGPALTVALQALAGQLEEFSLVFEDWAEEEEIDMEGLPAAVAGLRRLQRLRIDGLPCSWNMLGWKEAGLELVLPAEAPVWGSLRRLALGADAAAPNTAALTQAAKKLEWLGVFDVCSNNPAHCQLLREAARRLPRLRHLCIGQHAGPFAEVAAAAEQRSVSFVSFQRSPWGFVNPDRDVAGFWAAAFAE